MRTVVDAGPLLDTTQTLIPQCINGMIAQSLPHEGR
jgi:hypothetical protein